jgi:hypothetical protein
MANAVRKNNEVARRVEELAWTKEYAGEWRREKLLPGAAGSVKDKYGVDRMSSCIFNRLAQRRVMQTQFRQRLAGMKLKIVNDEIAFRGCGADRLLSGARHGRQSCCQEQCAENPFEQFAHLSPRGQKIYHKRGGAAAHEHLSRTLVLPWSCE